MTTTYFGGVPTAPDVRRLLEEFPTIDPGALVTYERIATIIGSEVGSSRFRGVTGAWRRTLLRVHNIVLVAVAGQGFRRVTEQERSMADRAGWRLDQARAARKVRDLARVDTSTFDEREMKSHEHARRVLQAHSEATQTSVRELAPPAPQKQLLRRVQ